MTKLLFSTASRVRLPLSPPFDQTRRDAQVSLHKGEAGERANGLLVQLLLDEVGMGLADACVVEVVDTLVIDLRMNAARVGRQTQTDCFCLPPVDGWEPITIRTSRAAEKSAKRRMGLPSDGRYGGWVMGVPQKFRNIQGHAASQRARPATVVESATTRKHQAKNCPFGLNGCSEADMFA